MSIIKTYLFTVIFLLSAVLSGCMLKIKNETKVAAVENSFHTKLNPLLPGYFADPTIKKFGDTYYIYSTTDNIMLASGAPTAKWHDNKIKLSYFQH